MDGLIRSFLPMDCYVEAGLKRTKEKGGPPMSGLKDKCYQVQNQDGILVRCDSCASKEALLSLALIENTYTKILQETLIQGITPSPVSSYFIREVPLIRKGKSCDLSKNFKDNYDEQEDKKNRWGKKMFLNFLADEKELECMEWIFSISQVAHLLLYEGDIWKDDRIIHWAESVLDHSGVPCNKSLGDAFKIFLTKHSRISVDYSDDILLIFGWSPVIGHPLSLFIRHSPDTILVGSKCLHSKIIMSITYENSKHHIAFLPKNKLVYDWQVSVNN